MTNLPLTKGVWTKVFTAVEKQFFLVMFTAAGQKYKVYYDTTGSTEPPTTEVAVKTIVGVGQGDESVYINEDGASLDIWVMPVYHDGGSISYYEA